MAFSHTTAAQLYGAPLPAHLQRDERIHLTVQTPARAPQIGSAVGHVTRELVVADCRGLPVTRPEKIWVDLAESLTREELIALGDYFLAHDLASPESLAEALGSSRGRRGIATARLALPLVRAGSESPMESALRVLLHDQGLAPPDPNYSIHGPDGRFLARVDLAYADHRVAVEYEGDHHRVERTQWHKDIHRQGRLEDLGWRVIRVTAGDLADPYELLARIRHALAIEW
ncbi:DUF559 domain-containing protein [Leifsonia sp. fls2-241-R2A-40a]|uniref:endonuclease domain-containing protein n=1 Tax=Leifsonia sp. fls2-241-R2A-40a TaxID=3040290 RepID=UPI002551499D|nr:DUF559 domain-containing protein [Leifsonia sp. fls2-241-R2A-40a]